MTVPEDERMTDFEALMWRLETDPLLRPAMGNVSILDGPVDVAGFRERLLGATVAVPRLRQRVVEIPGSIAPPMWRTVADFDVDRHLRVERLPRGANSLAAVYARAAELVSEPLDPEDPPWRFTVLTGLNGGRNAMVQVLHHSITDGEGGLKMSLAFMDFERHPSGRPGPARTDTVEAGEDAEASPPRSDGPPVGEFTDGLTYTLGRSMGFLRRTLDQMTHALSHPEELGAVPGGFRDVVNSFRQQFDALDGSSSELWHDRDGQRTFAAVSYPFAKFRATADSSQVTINDLFVAACVDAVRKAHDQAGESLNEVHVSVPVSTRNGRAGSNLFAPTVSSVPVGDDADEEQVLKRVSDSMHQVKGQTTNSMVEGAAGLAGLVPTAVIHSVGRRVTSQIELVCSNVRAAPFAVYIGGAEVLHNYPIGPLAGAAINVTVMSYAGNMNIGIHSGVSATSATDFAELLRGSLRKFVG